MRNKFINYLYGSCVTLRCWLLAVGCWIWVR